MECPHLSQLATLQPPKLSQSVHREECTQCFDNQDHPHGVDVCLTCFNGGCSSAERHHARTHVSRNSGHIFTLNIRRKLRPSSQRENDDEPPAKMTKLAIAAQTESDQYEHSTFIRCWACDPANGRELPSSVQTTGSVPALVNSVLTATSSARASEVQAWEEEIEACEHTLLLQQSPDPSVLNNGVVGTQCDACDLKENLWLCLTCGSLGCGRKQYGGVAGGNGHGLAHFESTGHPISVKLGTITPEGSADIYCYTCNDARIDPELALHLSTFGMNVASQTKTEKSMTELQIEHNLKFDFSLTDESGKALEPVFGPGLTGLSNLGNSCYMASTIQSLFVLPAFKAAYDPSVSSNHWETCAVSLPADCLTCQLLKLSDGLLSGRYSHPRPASLGPPKSTNELAHESPAPVFQEGVRPAAFKALVGKGHAEFSTMRQQDAEEFFSFLIESIQRDAKRGDAGPVAQAGAKATEVFKFGLESKLKCGKCGGVRYRTDGAGLLSVAVPAVEKGKDGEGKTLYEEVKLEECVRAVFGEEMLEYSCPKCAESVHATKGTKLASFPEVLVVHAKKFTLVNWVPAKLEIPLILPSDDVLVLDSFLGHGLQANETALPDDGPSSGAAALPAFNEAAMAQLEGMGFPTIRCQKALLATGNSDAEAAMEWLFAHMEDPDIDAPIQAGAASAAKEPSPEQISMLADMGFTGAQARKALMETDGNAERAVEWLFSHPDDMGLDTPAAPSASADASSTAASGNVGGNTTTPARYRLKAFISHKGPSVHSGHYVAHIRVSSGSDADEGWVLFNDEKVVKADAASIRDLRRHAYLYIFERV